MLIIIYKEFWKDFMINKSLYRNLPHISTKMQQMAMRLAEHCCPHENEVANKVVLWKPTDGKMNR